MRQDDASSVNQAAGVPDARDDADALPAGSSGPATGNTITGAGTITGAAGADVVTNGPGQIVALEGAGGSDSGDGGSLQVAGRFGDLTMNDRGGYSYEPNEDVPNGGRDVFRYTLADSAGARDTATLTIDIGRELEEVKADAQQIIPGPDGVVTLPPGVELSDVRVVGRNLVIDMPDGTQMVIIDGAVFVPQLVLGGVEVPASNLAALLIDAEPKPAAGTPLSSGGNFAVEVPPLDPGVPLGDLIPPTELAFEPPIFEDVGQFIDEEPEVGPNPAVQLDDETLTAGISGGTGDVSPDTANLTGVLSGSGGDGSLSFDLLTTGAPAGFAYVDGPNGSILIQQGGNTVITVTVNADTGQYTVVQNLPIAHPAGQNENDVSFTINYQVTDDDGDFANGTLVINVDDDTPTVTNVQSGPGVTLDETTAGTPDDFPISATSATAAITATLAFGADGPAASASTVYALSLTGGVSSLASGLATAIGNHPITLFQVDSDTIEGRFTDEGTQVAFTVQLNPDGTFTVTQEVPLEHLVDGGPGAAHDDSLSLAGLVNATVTITDSDTDPATGTAPIGGSIVFKDDGPTIDEAELNREATVTVDESAPVAAAAIDTGTIVKGDDPDLEGGLAIGSGSSGVAVVDANAVFGADGPAASGSLSYALSITNTVSGVTLTDGTAINLQMVGGVVVGVVASGTFAGQAAFAIAIDSATGVVSVEQYLSLDHPVNPDPNDPLGLGENTVAVTVTATDSDGDFDTSGAIDISDQITFLDDGPTAGGTANSAGAVTVDESGPTGASTIEFTGDEGDDPDVAGSGPIGRAVGSAAVVDGSAVFGADGPLAAGFGYALALGSTDTPLTLTDGSAIELQLIDGVVVGVVTEGDHEGEAAFAISINPTTGIATVELYLSLDHPDITDHNDSLPLGPNTVSVVVTATDGDGDTDASDPIDISGLFNFLDDGPTAGGTVDAQGAVTVDESGPTGASTIEFTGDEGDDPDVAGSGPIGRAVGGTAVVNASALFGADGEHPDSEFTYALQLGSTDTPLTLTDGSAIELQLIDGVIVGVVTEGDHEGDAAFAISVDPATGVATVELYLSLDHPDITDHNDSLPLGPNTVSVVVTATDGDGDSDDSAPIDISAQFNFLDDGPSVTATLSTGAAAVVDESLPVSTPAIDTGPHTKADDPHLAGALAIGAGSTTGAVINANALFGADGEADSNELTYDLVILNAVSGLTTTEGNAINLVQLDSGVVVGVVQGGTFAGQAAFAISIDSTTGVVTVEQYLSLDHPIFPNDFDEPVFLGEDVLGATVTATDGDGDTDTSDPVDIGSKIRFEDDGPSATDEAQQNVAEGGSIAGTFDFVGGADGATVTHVNGTVLVFGVDGFSQSIAVDDGSIKVKADGSYVFTANNPGSGVTSGTFTVTDGDGDQVEADWAFNITDANSPTAGTSTALLDDDGLAGGNPAGGAAEGDINANAGEVAPVNSEEDIFHGDLNFSFGGDGAGSINFAEMDGVLGTVGTETVVYDWDQASLTLTATTVGGTRPGTLLFTLELDDATSGEYTLTLNDNVLHAAGGNEASAPVVPLTFTVIDADNSPAGGVDGTLNITFNDDMPTLNVTEGSDTGVVLQTRDSHTDGNPTNEDSDSTAINFGGVFGLTFNAGADGAATPTLSYDLNVSSQGVNSGLTQGGAAIYLYDAGSSIIASTAASDADVSPSNTVFEVTVDASGVVTLTQYSQIDHTNTDPSPTGPGFTDHIISLADDLITLTASATITDGDGDVASDSETVDIGANLQFVDDGPDAQLSGQSAGTVTLDETRPEGDDRAGAAPAGTDSETIDFKTAFVSGGSVVFGADGPGTVTYSLVLTGTNVASGLYALQGTDTSLAGVDGDGYGQGDQIVLNQTSTNTITGAVNGTTYFTITIDPATGIVTFTQINNIWHPTPGTASFDETATLNTLVASAIKVVQTVTDADGDTDTAEVNAGQGVFKIQDDGPQAIQPDEATVTNTAGQSDTDVPLDDDGSLAGDFGTDLPGKITFANITPDGMATTQKSGNVTIELWLSADGQTLEGRTNSTDGTDGNLIYTVQIQADGTYDFTLHDEIDNGSGVSFADLSGGDAGNPAFKLIESSTADALEMLVTPIGNDTVNSDEDDIATGSQFIEFDDGIRFDFGQFTFHPNGGGGADDRFTIDEHETINGFKFSIDQISNGTVVDIRVTAIDADEDGGAQQLNIGPDADDEIDEITLVKVFDDNGVLVDEFSASDTTTYSFDVIFNGDGTVSFENLPSDYSIQTYTLDGYNRLSVFNEGTAAPDGKFSLSNLSIETTQQGDPIDLFFDIQITDADGDSIVLDDAIHVNVDPVGAQTLAATSTMDVSRESLEDTSTLSLMTSDSVDQQRTMSAANNNSVLLGAIAAAGLGVSSAAAANGFASRGDDARFDALSARDDGGLVQGSSVESGGSNRSALGGETQEAVDDQPTSSSSAGGSDDSAQLSLTDGGGEDSPAPSALSEGTELQSAPAETSFTSDSVPMASAEMLAAANENAVEGEAKATSEVGRVLADALAGGGGSNIDAAIDAVTNGANGANAALETLASHGAAAVSGWDSAGFADFTSGHSALRMDDMVLHPDAVQPAA